MFPKESSIKIGVFVFGTVLLNQYIEIGSTEEFIDVFTVRFGIFGLSGKNYHISIT